MEDGDSVPMMVSTTEDEGTLTQLAENGDKPVVGRFRVYVANLPPRTTGPMLEEAFGKVARVIGVLVPKTGRYAFLDFETAEAASRVIAEMDRFMLHGSSLRVELGKNNDGPKGQTNDARNKDGRRTARTKNRVVVTNLNPSTSWQDLKDIMRETGGDVTFTSVKDCVGFAEFGSEADLEKAIATLNDTEVAGYRVTIKRDEQSDRDLDRDQPAGKREEGGRRRRDRGRGGRRRQRSRSPSDRRRRRSPERRRSRSRRSPSRRRDRDGGRDTGGRDREGSGGRSRRDSISSASGSRSPPRRRRRRSRSSDR